MEDEENRRLIHNGKPLYPFTKQENVIGLQETIVEKLPIISSQEPQSGFVPKQAWLDISNDDGEQIIVMPSTPVQNNNSSGNNSFVELEPQESQETVFVGDNTSSNDEEVFTS